MTKVELKVSRVAQRTMENEIKRVFKCEHGECGKDATQRVIYYMRTDRVMVFCDSHIEDCKELDNRGISYRIEPIGV